MAVNNTGATAKKFIKPSYIVATLFTGSEEDDVPKGDSYILEDVVEDTTSIAQGIYGWDYCLYQILCSCSIQEIVCKD